MRLSKVYSDILTFGDIRLRIYGLAFVVAYLLFYFLLNKKKDSFLREETDLADLFLVGTLGLVFGARLGFILATLFDGNFYSHFPTALSLLAIWEGGLSFHGGLAGALVSLLIFRRLRNFNLAKLLDLASPLILLSFVFVRLANFFAGELVGRPYSGRLAVFYPGEEFGRYPSQLFEAIGALFLFLLVVLIRRYLLFKTGLTFLTFLLLSSILRFIVDFFREPTRLFGGLTLAQWLSLLITLFVFSYLYWLFPSLKIFGKRSFLKLKHFFLSKNVRD